LSEFINKTCLQCGADFLLPDIKTYRPARGRYCSQSCQGRAAGLANYKHRKGIFKKKTKKKVGRVTRKCIQCGTNFQIRPTESKWRPARFCSVKCKCIRQREQSSQVPKAPAKPSNLFMNRLIKHELSCPRFSLVYRRSGDFITGHCNKCESLLETSEPSETDWRQLRRQSRGRGD